MNIRHIEINDADAITTIYNYYISNSVITFEETPVSVEEMQRRIRSALLNALPWLVAETESGIAGYAYASKWKERSAYKHSVEISIYLASQATRQGLGTRLYTDLFKALKDININTVIGGIALPNIASVALHEKLGMEKVAHFKQVGFKFGRWVDVAYWQKQLSD